MRAPSSATGRRFVSWLVLGILLLVHGGCAKPPPRYLTLGYKPPAAVSLRLSEPIQVLACPDPDCLTRNASGQADLRTAGPPGGLLERGPQRPFDLDAVRSIALQNALTSALDQGILKPIDLRDTMGAPGLVSFGIMTAQAGEPPMTRMETGGGDSRAARQAASMTEMMGAPGLVPFDIMTGQAGKWMVGYQFMFEQMDGNLVGTDDISESEILNSYFATPTDMTMQMHMGMVMYAPTDKLTLMALLPYIRKEMNHVTVDGARFVERTEGIGDIELRGMYSVFETKEPRHWLLLNGGVGLPTGSIDAKMDGMRLEYPMQIGSGTFSLLPGFTYLGQELPWGWAVDFSSTVRLGRNDNGYRLGNRYQLSGSITRVLANSVSLSAGARGELWENIVGSDPLLDPTDEPTKDPNLQGGKRLSALLGITFHPENGFFKNQHFHLQAELPVVQSLDGPQLQRSYVIRFGWQLEF